MVFPGGGYRALAMGLEGTEICDWLTSRGITRPVANGCRCAAPNSLHEFSSLIHAVPDAHLCPASVHPVGSLPYNVKQDFIIKQERDAHAGMVGGRVM